MVNSFLTDVARINAEIASIPEVYHALIVKKDKWSVMHPALYHMLVVGIPVFIAWGFGRLGFPWVF